MDHGTKIESIMRIQPNTVEKITIGSDVWLGANVTVLKGSKIGDGAVVGAKSLVKGVISGNSISVGIPAKQIKNRL